MDALETGDWSLLTSGRLPGGPVRAFEWLPNEVDQLFLKVEAE